MWLSHSTYTLTELDFRLHLGVSGTDYLNYPVTFSNTWVIVVWSQIPYHISRNTFSYLPSTYKNNVELIFPRIVIRNDVPIGYVKI